MINPYWKAGASIALGLAIVLSSPLAVSTIYAQDRPAATADAKSAEIDDAGKLFDAKAVEEALPALEKASREVQIPTKVETVGSLEGKTIDEVSLNRAMHSGREGLYVLLAKEEKKIEVRVSRRFKTHIDAHAQRSIREAFVSGLRKGDPDLGLKLGVEAIVKVLAQAPKPPHEETKTQQVSWGIETAKSAHANLVIRDQIRLSLAGAKRIVEGAEKKAAELGLKVNIAVVDDGGHMITFSRMDGARPASGYTATTKAVTAATFRQETGPLPKGAPTTDVHLNLSLQNAAAASGGKLTTLYGGVPVLVDKQVIGGVGVGGGTGEQDAAVAKAGIEAFLSDLKPSEPATAPAAEKHEAK